MLNGARKGALPTSQEANRARMYLLQNAPLDECSPVFPPPLDQRTPLPFVACHHEKHVHVVLLLSVLSLKELMLVFLPR